MDVLSLPELEGLDWKPRRYVRGPDGTRYGYDKATHPLFDLGIAGVAVDFVRVRSGHVIEEHYHEEAVENFAVLGTTPALFQTRRQPDEVREERKIFPGEAIRIHPGELHRVVNNAEEPLYLWRHAVKAEGDYHSAELAYLLNE